MNRPIQTNIPRHSIPKLAIKGLIALGAAFFLLLLFLAVLQLAVEESGYTTDTDMVNWCQRDYYDRDFASLFDTLTLFDLYDEKFDLYWEAVQGHQTLVQYRQWRQAEAQGIDGAAGQARQMLDTLERLARSPAFPENESLLARMYEEALDLS